MQDQSVSDDRLHQFIVEIAVEAWRFRRVFERAMSKLDAGDSARYISQFAWFDKRVNAALEATGYRIVNVEGQLYDVGMAVSPLNIDEFEAEDRLYVEQMMEPIVMNANTIVKAGAVILGRANA